MNIDKENIGFKGEFWELWFDIRFEGEISELVYYIE